MMMAEPLHRAGVSGALTEHEPMARHVTWRAGGAARYAFRPADRADLIAFFRNHRALLEGYPPLFVGLGSNLLVRDRGIAATAIFTHPGLQELRIAEATPEAMTIVAEAGVAAPKLARYAANHELEGAEFLAGKQHRHAGRGHEEHQAQARFLHPYLPAAGRRHLAATIFHARVLSIVLKLVLGAPLVVADDIVHHLVGVSESLAVEAPPHARQTSCLSHCQVCNKQSSSTW